MARSDRPAQDGYQPITEGYQPGRVKATQTTQKAYAPISNAGSTTQEAPRPPSGGSSAAKPAKK